MTEFTPFDAAEYLDDEESIAAFLEEASQGADAASIALALGAIARARNVSQLARDTGMTRAGIYKALTPGGKPSFETVMRIAHALGFEMALRPIEGKAAATKPAGRRRGMVADAA